MIMKRMAAFLAILFLGTCLASAQTKQSSARFSNPLLNDVVRMSDAGMRPDTIVAYVKARESRLDMALTADDLIELRRANVHEHVIEYLASAASFAGAGRSGAVRRRPAADYDEGETVAVDPGYSRPSYGWGWGWGWGWPYYGGWWGGPYWGGTVVIGGRFGHRGHFRHR